jgi:hypothetical protein
VSDPKPDKGLKTIPLGDLMQIFYEEYLTLYGDEDIASVAAAATINDILNSDGRSTDPPKDSGVPKKNMPES